MADVKARAVILSAVITAGVLTVVNSEMMGNPAKVSANSNPSSYIMFLKPFNRSIIRVTHLKPIFEKGAHIINI